MKVRRLTESETATILHSLRAIQHGAHCGDEGYSCDHFEGRERLTSFELAALCEKINPIPTPNLLIEEEEHGSNPAAV